MPIISPIGRRSTTVRSVYAAMFILLTVGAVTMVYPFLLMVCGSFKSDADSEGLSIYPAYWHDNHILHQKYLEARYGAMDQLEPAHQITYRSWRKTAPVEQLTNVEPLARDWVDAYRAYRDQADWPDSWFFIGQGQSFRFYRLNARQYRNGMSRRFDGDLQAINHFFGTGYVTWEQVGVPREQLSSRRYRSGIRLQANEMRSTFRQFKLALRKRDRIPVNVDGFFGSTYLRTLYPTVADYNREHDTHYKDYRRVLLRRRAPRQAKARQDWENFVRDELNLCFIRLDEDLTPAYRAFLAQGDQYADVAAYNDKHATAYDRFEQVPFPTAAPDTHLAQEDWSKFISDRQRCPLNKIEVYGPRQAFLAYLAARNDLRFPDTESLPLPLAEADHADLLNHRREIRWEETRRNYIHVLDYVLLHGRAVRNTLIYCGLLVLTTLLVNPLGAYALSRYRPPSQYKVLLICMATMAFPGEVTMIPSFFLLKQFPIWNLLTGVAVSAAVLYVGFKRFSKVSDMAVGLTATMAGVLAGWWLAPQIAGLFGYPSTSISLLNTFAALVLPSMANGYGLFLLKGFFDSLPRELYESADIDGAGEWTKFWSFTMALSKPILAVLALGAFTSAYSEFMMALIIIPDRDMWTLMVWIFQLQITAPQPVIHTSVLIAAVPTFIVFIFCQNIIIRGIVVPVEK